MPSYFGGAAGSRLVLLVFHPLLRDEQHSRCNHQPAADQIEDRGADAAGAGQGGASLIYDLDAARIGIFSRGSLQIRIIDRNSLTVIQLVITLGCSDFFQIVITIARP